MLARWTYLSALSLLLAACGGGGGDGSSQLSAGTNDPSVSEGENDVEDGESTPPDGGDDSAPEGGNSNDYAVDASARFNMPSDLAFSDTGELFVLDEGNRLIRKISPTGEVTTVPVGFDEDNVPKEIGADLEGNVYLQYGTDLFAVTPGGEQNLLYSAPGEWSRRIPFLLDFMVDEQGRWYPINSYSKGRTWYSTYRYGPGEWKQEYEFKFRASNKIE